MNATKKNRVFANTNAKRLANASRRQVLRNLTLAGLVVSSATAITFTPAAARSEKSADNSLNYLETDHVRRYYALLRN